MSLVQFVARKNGDTDVTGRFTAIGGGVDIDPADLRTVRGELDIDFATIKSGDEARDKSLSAVFFAATTPDALHGNIALTSFRPEKSTIAVGETVKADATLAVNLGVEINSLNVAMTLHRMTETRWEFALVDGFTVSVEALGLGKRLEALIEFCQHKSVGDDIKASGKLVFGV